MRPDTTAVTGEVGYNWTRLKVYLIAVLGLYFASLGAIALKGKLLFAAIGLAAPVALILISQPRAVMYLFVVLLYVQWEILSSIPLSITDLGAMLVILTAILDTLLNESSPGRRPVFVINYLVLLGVLLVAGIFGYSFMLSTRPLARVALLFAIFLAVYRLSAKVSMIKIVRFYYWLCVAHAAIGLAGFVYQGGRSRSFGLLPTTLDDFTMIALPIGLAFYLWSGRTRATRYFVGTLIVLGALIATQSRATIMFGIFAAILAAIVSWKRASSVETDERTLNCSPRDVKRRVKTLVWAALVLSAVILALKPGLLAAVGARFDRLITTQPGETFRLRLVLWNLAITTFAKHPLLGIGPGAFRSLPEINPMLHLEPLLYYVRGLSAHNLLLHYLAEAGLIGAGALVALFVNQFRRARQVWHDQYHSNELSLHLSLYMVASLLLFTTFLEAGWMWGELGFVAAFFIALVARRFDFVSSADRKSLINQPTLLGTE
jgi:O-antigen ligase